MRRTLPGRIRRIEALALDLDVHPCCGMPRTVVPHVPELACLAYDRAILAEERRAGCWGDEAQAEQLQADAEELAEANAPRAIACADSELPW